MAKGHRVVDHIVDYLAATGVDYIFGVDGANIEDLYDAAFFRDDITAVLAKHEFSAATMADGYSRSGAGPRRRGRNLRRRLPEYRCGAGRVVGQPGAGAGAGRSASDDARRPRRLPGHQWPQRGTERRGAVLRGVGVLQAGAGTRGHRQRCCPRRSPRPNAADPRSCCCRKTSSRPMTSGERSRRPPVTRDCAGRPATDRAGAAECRRPDHDHCRRAGGP